MEGVPIAEGAGGGDAEIGEGDDARGDGKVSGWFDLFAATGAEDSAADEKERDVGADLGGEG